MAANRGNTLLWRREETPSYGILMTKYFATPDCLLIFGLWPACVNRRVPAGPTAGLQRTAPLERSKEGRPQKGRPMRLVLFRPAAVGVASRGLFSSQIKACACHQDVACYLSRVFFFFLRG